MVTTTMLLERRFNYDQRQKGRCYSQDPYRLPYQQWPEALAAEFSAYEEWRTAAFVPGRPPECKQRSETLAGSVIEFECYFGYLTNILNRPVHILRLTDICNVEWLSSYADWHIKHRTDGPSRFIEKTMADFMAAARHYLKANAVELEAIGSLKAQVKPETMRDKRERWNSLTTLEAVGLAEYPNGQEFPNPVYAALAAQRSLIIRLLVRRPLRSRNIREMQLGRNLYRTAKGWDIEFRGMELKVNRRRGQENVYHVSFPPDLVATLEEFLERWRPMLNTGGSNSVFLSRSGTPLSQIALNRQIKGAIYERTGRGTNIHLFRDIWATGFIIHTQNLTAAAMILGDELETVLRRYAHLQAHDASQQADKFVAEVLGNDFGPEKNMDQD